MPRMSMGTRETDQLPLWIAASDLPASPGHPFYVRLNAVLDTHGFDRLAEDQCRAFDAKVMRRPLRVTHCFSHDLRRRHTNDG